MKNSYLYLILGLLALAIGFFVNRKDGGGGEREAASALTDTKSKSTRFAQRRNAEIQILNQVRRLEGGEQNWLRWVAELENASREDLPRFLENMPKKSSEAMDLLAERWFELGPEEALDYFSKRFEAGEMEVGIGEHEIQIMHSLFGLWSKRDLEGVVAAVDVLEAFPYLKERHRGLAEKLAQKDPERGLRYAMQNGVNRSGWIFFVRGKKLQRLIAQNPVKAADLIFEWGGAPGGHAEKELVKTWGKMNPKQAISYGLKRGNSVGSQFADGVFLSWAKRDYGEASDWVAEEASEKEALLFTAPLVEVWAEDQPVAALSWAEEELTGEVLQESAKRIILGALEKEENDVGELLQVVQSSEVHHEVVVALAEKLWGTGASQSRPKADRELHLERLAWFDHVTDQRSLNQLAEYFTRATSEVGTEWLEGFASSSRMSLLDRNGASSVLRNLAREGDYERSFEMMKFVDERYQRSVASDVFVTWLRRDPEASIVWMDEVANEEWRPQLTRAVTDEFFFNLRGDSVESFRQLAEKYPVRVKELVRDEVRRIQLIDSASDFEGEAPEVSFDEILNVLSE